ncbi:MAG: hypothetical protein AB7E76_10345 [Deferribacterales bacterium]|jgi:hypothetical protein
MYVSNASVQTMNLRYSYSDSQSAKTKEGQTAANSEKSEESKTENTEKSTNFLDVLSVMSKDVSPTIQNIDAYIKDTVTKVLEKIARHASETFSGQSESFSLSVTSISISIELDAGESIKDVQSQLSSMLGDDGYWGVEKTSQRMFDFAVGIAGDDPVQLEKARDAVTKGFEQAEAMWGGKLPDISYDTYNATMEKFDSYLSNINSSLSATYA